MDLSNPTNLVIAAAYYILTIGLTFFSLFGIYILIRYGKSTIFSLIIALFYAFIYLKILTDSYQNFKNLLS